jgi:hypothetical protein
VVGSLPYRRPCPHRGLVVVAVAVGAALVDRDRLGKSPVTSRAWLRLMSRLRADGGRETWACGYGLARIIAIQYFGGVTSATLILDLIYVPNLGCKHILCAMHEIHCNLRKEYHLSTKRERVLPDFGVSAASRLHGQPVLGSNEYQTDSFSWTGWLNRCR